MECYNGSKDNNNYELSLIEFYEIIKRNSCIIIITTLGMALLMFLISVALNFIETKTFYKVITKIKVEVADQYKKEQTMQAVVDLMRRETVIKKAVENARIENELENVKNNLQFVSFENTNIIEIIVNHQSKILAKKLADEICKEGISLIRDILPMKEVKVKVIEDTLISTVKTDSQLNYSLNAFVGGVIGCIGVIFFVLLKHVVDDKIVSEEDIKECLGLEVLVSIPNYASNFKIKRYFRIR